MRVNEAVKNLKGRCALFLFNNKSIEYSCEKQISDSRRAISSILKIR